MKRIVSALFWLLLAAPLYAQGPCILQQSTANQEIGIGPFLSSSDGNTEQTALTIANTDVRLKKGSNDWVPKNLGGATSEEHGWYRITLDATDTSTVGELIVSIHVSTALAVWKSCWVEANFVRSNYNLWFQNGGSATTKIVNDTGGGTGTTDWTATERDMIRYRLGVDGSTQTPTTNVTHMDTFTLRKNVAGQSMFVLFFDASGNVKTGLAGTFTCNISKDYAAFAGSSGTKTEVGLGWYKLTLSQAETAADLILFECIGSGARAYTAYVTTLTP